MKSRILKYGKVFATKVAMKDTLPVHGETTGLNCLEKEWILFATGLSVGAVQSLDGGQPSDYMTAAIQFAWLRPRIDKEDGQFSRRRYV